MWDETTNGRLLPGEGAFGVAETLALLAAHGVRAPVAVEVLSDRLRLLSAAEASTLAYRTSVETLARSRAMT
jgi:sugar phosphate isomerase/epimerase